MGQRRMHKRWTWEVEGSRVEDDCSMVNLGAGWWGSDFCGEHTRARAMARPLAAASQQRIKQLAADPLTR